jgi:uncharacterized membrane protein YoaK (UPF0700 family)
VPDSGSTGAAAPEGALSGRFPACLLLLTAAAGVVDATSYLAFNHAFAATLTGNLVFVGLAGIGAPGFLLTFLVGAIAGFFVGAFFAGRWIHRRAGNRVELLRSFTSIQLIPIGLAAIVALVVRSAVTSGALLAMLVLLAFSMGVQAVGAARMKVPGLERTTVLTTTFANIGADAFATREGHAVSIRWILSIVALVGGAVVGGALYLRTELWVPLAVAAAIVAIVALAAFSIREAAV